MTIRFGAGDISVIPLENTTDFTEDYSTLSGRRSHLALSEAEPRLRAVEDVLQACLPVSPVIAAGLSDLKFVNNGQTLSGRSTAGAVIHVFDSGHRIIGKGLAGDHGGFDVALTTRPETGSIVGVAQQQGPATALSQPIHVMYPVAEPSAHAAPDSLVLAAGDTEPGVAASESAAALTDNDVTADNPFLEIMATWAVEEDTPKEYVTGYAAADLMIEIFCGTRLVGLALSGTDGYFKAYIPAVDLIRAEPLTVVYTDVGGQHRFITEAPDFEHPHTVTDLIIRDDWSGISGRGVSGMIIEVRNEQGDLVGSAAVDAKGKFDVFFDQPLLTGQYLSVVEHSILDKFSDSVFLQLPSHSEPATPTVNMMDEAGLNVTGSGEPGKTITVYGDDHTTILGTATVSESGAFDVSLAFVRNHGETLYVKQTSEFGIDSQAVAVHAWDITVPDEPVADPMGADGLHLTGHGVPGDTITVYDADHTTVLGTATVDGDGFWDVLLSSARNHGETLHVKQTSHYAVDSATVDVHAWDITVPDEPVVDPMVAEGLHLTGHGQPGHTITVYDADHTTVLATATVDGDGFWDVLLLSARNHGETLHVKQTSHYGVDSASVDVHAWDLTQPAAPSDLHIDNAGLIVTGSGTPDTIVKVFDPTGKEIGHGVVATDGSFAIRLDHPYTAHQLLSVKQFSLYGVAGNPAHIYAPNADLETAIDRGLDSEVTALHDGGWLVTWRSSEANGSSILQQRYDANGDRVGGEIKVNPDDTYTDRHAKTIVLADGGWVTTYESVRVDRWDIYQQRFDADGKKMGTETRVNEIQSAVYEGNQQIVAFGDGGWMIIWNSYNGWVYSQRYDKDGTPVGHQTLESSTQNDAYAHIVELEGGGYAVVWYNYGALTPGLYASIKTADWAAGHPIGYVGDSSVSEVAALKDGSWMIAAVTGGSIKIKHMSAAGSVIADWTTVNPAGQSEPGAVQITGLSDGGWVVTWQAVTASGTGKDIYEQRYDSAGSKVGKVIAINTIVSEDQLSPSIAGLDDGGWLVTWHGPDARGLVTVYQQRFDANGNRVATDNDSSDTVFRMALSATDDHAGHPVTELAEIHQTDAASHNDTTETRAAGDHSASESFTGHGPETAPGEPHPASHSPENESAESAVDKAATASQDDDSATPDSTADISSDHASDPHADLSLTLDHQTVMISHGDDQPDEFVPAEAPDFDTTSLLGGDDGGFIALGYDDTDAAAGAGGQNAADDAGDIGNSFDSLSYSMAGVQTPNLFYEDQLMLA